MSTKPCPQCGSAVPLQARFCGQCGRTFAEPTSGRSIPTTLDEAASRGPSPGQAAAPAHRPPLGMATVIGHASVVAAPPLSTASPVGLPMAKSAPTAPASGPADFSKTIFDPSPYGAETAAERSSTSQRPTPLVPPPSEHEALSATSSAAPEVSSRGDSTTKPKPQTPRPGANEAGTPARPAPAFAKTIMLGGVLEPAVPSSTVTAPSPAQPVPGSVASLAAAPPRIADASPLSRSVLAPSGAPPSLETGAPNQDSRGLTGNFAGDPGASAHAARDIPAPTPHDGTVSLLRSGTDKKTMLGMPATGLGVPSPQPQPQAIASASKTMLGVAIPGIAPTPDTQEKPAVQPPPRANERAGTLLGVAAPGIAPTRISAPQNAQPAREVLQPASAPIVPAPAPLVMEPLPEAPHIAKKKGVPAVAVVGIVFVLVALIGTGATFLVLRSAAPLAAQPQLDESGKESLNIRCDSCPDGTMISLGASSSKVEGATALLALPAPLSIGDNDLEMKIDRPPPGRDETVKVHVPVAYRVKADLSTLTTGPAAITVRVEALAGSEVTVDGKPVALDSSGRGSQTIDVTSDVEGPSDEQKTLDKKIPFTVKPKDAASPENGQLLVRTGVAPLHIDAPGIQLYTNRSTANVSGQVKPGSTLTVDGQNVAVDANGRFGVRVELPASGDKALTIVANAPPLAPRTVRSKIVRVPSIEAAARTLDAKSPLVFDAFAPDPKSKLGHLAVVDGEIQEIRTTGGYTVMAVEEKKACSAGPGRCLVRIVHGEEVTAARGDTLRAYGRVEGSTSTNGKSIPDIHGVLVLTKPAAKR